jgi:hypothetical protein
VVTHARPLAFGTYPSDSLQPGLGPVDPTPHSASHSGPGPPADTMVRVPHGSWRDDAARVVRSSLMSTEVSLATSLHATWSALTSQPTIPAAFRRPSRLCVQTVTTAPSAFPLDINGGCIPESRQPTFENHLLKPDCEIIKIPSIIDEFLKEECAFVGQESELDSAKPEV